VRQLGNLCVRAGATLVAFGPMEIGLNLKRLRTAKQLSQSELARKAGVSQQLISPLERGENVTTNKLPKIARTLGARVADIDPAYKDQAPISERYEVPLVGYVGAGAIAHFYGSGDDPDEFVPAPDEATPDTVAVEIRGTSLGAIFEHWLVYYDDVRAPVTADMIGRLCVVGLPDDRVLVKQIRKSKSPGLFHLLSNSGDADTLLDQEVSWAARVRSMVPRG
jgi:transcriptional regulator with XRE-family HTH domain